MAADLPLLVALELGTTKVRALVGETRDDDHLMIIGLGECAAQGIRKSEITDFDLALECARVALHNAEENGNVGIKQVHLLVSGGYIRSLVNRGSIPIMTRGNEITRDEIEHVMDTARAVNLQGDIEILHSICQHFYVDDQRGVVNPEGLRFEDEMVRHKILDFMGDIAVGSRRLWGHFEVSCSGHDFNNRFMRYLFDNSSEYLEFVNLEGVAGTARKPDPEIVPAGVPAWA